MQKKVVSSIVSDSDKAHNFSILINMKDLSYETISTNEYVDKVEKSPDAFKFLQANALANIDKKYQKELIKWFRPKVILSELKKQSAISKDFYSKAAAGWFRGVFMIEDYDEHGSIYHVIYGCQNITESKEKEIDTLKESLQQLKILKSLSGIFYSLHLIDLVNDSVTVYNAKDEVKDFVTAEVKGASLMMRRIIETTSLKPYLKSALYFTDLTTVADRMKNKKMISAEFEGTRTGWYEASFITIEKNHDGKPTKVIFATRTIDKEKQREKELVIQSNTDELTGFYNRRAYESVISEYEKKGWRKNLTYVSIDINGLKVANDTIGHEAGDELIIGACDCMNQCFGPYGKLYRIGGDEFVALLNVNEKQLEKIKNDIEEVCENWQGQLVGKVSLSCGYVSANEKTDFTMHKIIVLADKRMYQAKNRYYSKKGIDRRGQRDAHIALCAMYTKILKINLESDSYQIINMNKLEQTKEFGFADKLSDWLRNFGTSGHVHPDDLQEYLAKTDLAYMSEYFRKDNKLLRITYRRKCGQDYQKIMMEIIPSNDYSDDDQNLFLYVKAID